MRLIVMPPEVTATTEPGSPCVAADPAAVATIGNAEGAKGFPLRSQDAHGEKVAKISPPTTLKSSSNGASWFGKRLKFIASVRGLESSWGRSRRSNRDRRAVRHRRLSHPDGFPGESLPRGLIRAARYSLS